MHLLVASAKRQANPLGIGAENDELDPIPDARQGSWPHDARVVAVVAIVADREELASWDNDLIHLPQRRGQQGIPRMGFAPTRIGRELRQVLVIGLILNPIQGFSIAPQVKE